MTIPVPCTVLRWINVGERPKLHSCEIYGNSVQQCSLPGMTPLCLHELIRPPIEELQSQIPVNTRCPGNNNSLCLYST